MWKTKKLLFLRERRERLRLRVRRAALGAVCPLCGSKIDVNTTAVDTGKDPTADEDSRSVDSESTTSEDSDRHR